MDGHFITTFTGKKFHYLNPSSDEFDIRDIAHALSLVCRFGGHVREFYSVAEHSIRVAEEVANHLKLPALLHDAHEAYLHDVPRPIKHDMVGYMEIANRIQALVEKKYLARDPNPEEAKQIKWADDALLSTEARDLLPNVDGWAALLIPLEETLYPWTSSDAEASFLTYFRLWSGRAYGGRD